MDTWGIWFAALPGLILFLYGIEQFSKEIQRAAGGRFRSFLTASTKHPVLGVLLGVAVTATTQSSTAVTVITVGLVDAGMISFAQSVGVILGTNIGTTITAQLVAFKAMAFAPILIPVGFLLSILGGKYSFIGRPIFFFGLVFFSLSLVSAALEPLKDDPSFVEYSSAFDDVLIAIIAGFVITNIFQSSAVFAGLVILLAGNGLISVEQSIPLILGSNLGTTTTSILAAATMGLFAKRAAAAHVLFNLFGVLLILPFLPQFTDLVVSLGGAAANQVANAHLLFNAIACAVFLVAIGPFTAIVERVVPGKETELLLKTKVLGEKLPESTPEAFLQLESELRNMFSNCEHIASLSFGMLEGYSARKLKDLTKLEAINDYLNMRIERAILELSARDLSEGQAFRIMLLVRMANVLEQLADIGAGIGYVAKRIADEGGLAPDAPMASLNPVYSLLKENLSLVQSSLPSVTDKDIVTMRQNEAEMRKLVNAAYLARIAYLRQSGTRAGGAFVKIISRMEAASAKLREIRKLAEMYTAKKAS